MRKCIGWTERDESGKWDVEVTLEGGKVVWRRQGRRGERREAMEPTADQWRELASRMKDRYARRQVSWEDLQRVERLAREAGAP